MIIRFVSTAKANDVTDSDPRVWVGCAGCYASGKLVGFWVQADQAPTSMVTDPEELDVTGFNAWLDDRATPVAIGHFQFHEELFVGDSENVAGLLLEGASPADARRVGALITALNEYPIQPETFAKAWRDQNPGRNLLADVDPDDISRLLSEMNYDGQWSSVGAYAEARTGDLYGAEIEALPADVVAAIDWEEVGEARGSNGEFRFYTWHNGVYIFRNE